MDEKTVGFAFCGSYCTFAQAMEVLERIKARYGSVYPIVSERVAATAGFTAGSMPMNGTSGYFARR